MERLGKASAVVEGVRAGDREVWAELYRRAYPRLVAFAYRRLGHLDEAKDAVSETMTRAVAGIDRFTGNDAGLLPWLVGICRHVVADTQRAKHRFGCEEIRDCAADKPDPAEEFVKDEDRALVRTAFARLDRDDQELLELRVVAGLSSDEVAVVLGKKPGAVRMAQMRALGRLRTFIQEASRVG